MLYMLLLLGQLFSFSATWSVLSVDVARDAVRQLRAALDCELHLVPCTCNVSDSLTCRYTDFGDLVVGCGADASDSG